MSLLTPAFLWTFAALIPLAAVYFLKVRPRKRETTAFFLWQKVFTGKRSSALFQRLRDVWSLLLMALAFSALALALSGPEFARDERKDLLLIVDQSASMQAGGRLAEAKQKAADIIKALNGSQRAAIATIDSDLRFVSHLSDDPRTLIDAVETIAPGQLPLKLQALKSFQATQSSDWAASHRLLFLTDGCFEASVLPPNVEVVKIGETLENVGLVSADFRFLPGSNGQCGLYFQVASSFKSAIKGEVSLEPLTDAGQAGAIAKLIPLDITPGLNPPQTFTVESVTEGRWQLRIATSGVKDAWAGDNLVPLAAIKPPPVKVAVSAADRFFFENSVLAFSRGGGWLELVTEAPQIVVGRKSLPEAPLGLVFQPEGESPWWKDLGPALEEAPVPVVKVNDHPVIRFIDAGSMNFAGARQLKSPPGSIVLVSDETTNTPLLYLTQTPDKSVIVVNLDPEAADFYLSAWFPVLVYSAATHLAGREEELAAVYPTGATFPIPGATENSVSQVTTPAGQTIDLQSRSFGPASETGYYSLKSSNNQSQAAVALLHSDESLLDNSALSAPTPALASGSPPATWLIILAVLLLVAESLLYHRRKVG